MSQKASLTNTGAAIIYSDIDDATRRDRIERGLYVPERLPQGAQRAIAGSTLEAATHVAEGSHGPVSEFARDLPDYACEKNRKAQRSLKRERGEVFRLLEEQSLFLWASQNQKLKNGSAFSRNWKAGGEMGGNEHDVYYDQKRDVWLKKANLNQSSDYLDYFQRLALHQWLFPETAYTLEGFVQDKSGNYPLALFPVVSQKNVRAELSEGRVLLVRPEEVSAEMEQRGFLPYAYDEDEISAPVMQSYEHPTGVLVGDVHHLNVIREASTGLLAFIDPIIELNPATKAARLRRELAGKPGADKGR